MRRKLQYTRTPSRLIFQIRELTDRAGMPGHLAPLSATRSNNTLIMFAQLDSARFAPCVIPLRARSRIPDPAGSPKPEKVTFPLP